MYHNSRELHDINAAVARWVPKPHEVLEFRKVMSELDPSVVSKSDDELVVWMRDVLRLVAHLRQVGHGRAESKSQPTLSRSCVER